MVKLITKVLENIYKIDVPLPKNPLKSTNSYILTSKERNLVIDTGMNREECYTVLKATLEELAIDLSKTDFFITHMHADHGGLVSELKTPTSKVYCSSKDNYIINLGRDKEYWGATKKFLGKNGFPQDLLDEAINTHPGYKYCARVPIDFIIIEDGYSLDIGEYHFRAFSTPGHTRGHLCLYESNKKLLFSGDHLLIDITPNISLFDDEANPLQEYLDSLDKTSQLDISLVLPGHRRIFEDYKGRIEQLKRHHQARTQEVLEILGNQAMNGYQVSSKMTWDLTYKTFEEFPVQQKWFATGEGLAHIKYLMEQGLVERTMVDGMYIFRCV